MPYSSNATTETAVFDSSEFISGRTALGLDELGLQIVSADWGESDMELFMVKKELGEVPAERHPPNRTVTLKLKASKSRTIPLAEVADRLQKKIHTLQEYGGWIKRMMDPGGQFKREVGCMVFKASLVGLQGWLMAHREIANEITVVLTCAPYFYSTVEEEQTITSVTAGREIEWELSEVKGSAPGLIRIQLTNNNTGTTGDWHAALASAEQQYYSSATTAKRVYLASELTKLGVAASGTRAGSSGTNTVKMVLQNEWQPMLSSAISGSAMTHIGPRRMLYRVYDPNAAGQVFLKIQWKPLGSDYWTTNEELKTYTTGFQIMDLGEARPEIATLGNQSWEWRILARSSTLGLEVELDRCWILSTEQFLEVAFKREAETYNILKLEDYYRHAEAESSEPGGNRKATQIGGTYEALGRAQAGGIGFRYKNVTNTFNTTPWEEGLFDRKVWEDTEPVFLVCPTKLKSLKFTSFLYRLGDIGGEAKANYAAPGVCNGIAFRVVDKLNYGFMYLEQTSTAVQSGLFNRYKKLVIGKCIAGVKTILKELLVVVNSETGSGFFNVTVDTNGVVTGSLTRIRNIMTYNGSSYTILPEGTSLSATDSVFATAGTLAEGKVGIFQYSPKVAEYQLFRVGWGELRAEEVTVEERGAVCYSGKKLELRTEGIFREGITEAAWARLTPIGFLPSATPSGLETRPLKGIVIPTRGDFESQADSETNNIGAKIFYRPGYLFLSGVNG